MATKEVPAYVQVHALIVSAQNAESAARNATMKIKGVNAWRGITLDLVKDPQNWLRTFHDRSISETANSMMKRREPTPLRKRLNERRDTEEFLKGNIHNIRQCGYLVYLKPQYVNFKVLAG